MPRAKVSPRTRRAVERTRKARWRSRTADQNSTSQSNGRQPGQYVAVGPSASQEQRPASPTTRARPAALLLTPSVIPQATPPRTPPLQTATDQYDILTPTRSSSNSSTSRRSSLRSSHRSSPYKKATTQIANKIATIPIHVPDTQQGRGPSSRDYPGTYPVVEIPVRPSFWYQGARSNSVASTSSSLRPSSAIDSSSSRDLACQASPGISLSGLSLNSRDSEPLNPYEELDLYSANDSISGPSPTRLSRASEAGGPINEFDRYIDRQFSPLLDLEPNGTLDAIALDEHMPLNLGRIDITIGYDNLNHLDIEPPLVRSDREKEKENQNEDIRYVGEEDDSDVEYFDIALLDRDQDDGDYEPELPGRQSSEADNNHEVDDDDAADLQLRREEESSVSSMPGELGQHLLHFQGCSATKHAEQEQRHFAPQERMANHRSLSDMENIFGVLPNVIDNPVMMKTPREHQHAQPEWPRVFEGYQPEDLGDEGEEAGQDEIHVCMYRTNERQLTRYISRFDIDSLLGFASSLAFMRFGLNLNFAPQYYANISKSIHLFQDVLYDFGKGPKVVRVPLHHVPHYCFGRVIGQEDISVYFFFPRQYNPEMKSNFPGRIDGEKHKILETWTDKILLPALASYISADMAQHLPASFHDARLRSNAAFKEGYARTQSNKRVRLPGQYYPIQADILHQVWTEMQRLILSDPEYIRYRDVQIFFSSKNHKLLFKYNTLHQTEEAFFNRLNISLDLSYLDSKKIWIDLGKETVCTSWAWPSHLQTLEADPSVYLWRPCCQDAFHQWLLTDAKPSHVRRVRYYKALLSDVQDTTFETSPRSKKRQEGYAFGQMYNSDKEAFDASKTKPFQHPGLAKFAWDSKVLQMLDHQGRSVTALSKVLKQNYLQSKIRLSQSLHYSYQRSYGIREEHRITFEFFSNMKASLQASGDWDRQPFYEDHLPFWVIPSQTYITYLLQNANKFLFAFEWIFSLNTNIISYEHCKVLTLFLDLVRCSFDSAPLERKTELWRNEFQKNRNEVPVHGLGLQETMTRSSYGWLLPKINWETMAFKAEITHQMVYHETSLRDTFHRNWTGVKDVKDDYKKIETLGHWLLEYQGHPNIVQDILNHFSTIVVRHFRKEVFRNLEKEIRPDYREAALRGDVFLCYDGLASALCDPRQPDQEYAPYIINSNRSKTKTVRQLVDLLWDWDDGIARTGWASRGYRCLCRRAEQIIEIHKGKEHAHTFHDAVKRRFVLTNWVVPYPNDTKFFQRNSDKARMWIGLYHQDLIQVLHSNQIICYDDLLQERHDKYCYIGAWNPELADLMNLPEEEDIVYVKDGDADDRFRSKGGFMSRWDLVDRTTSAMAGGPAETTVERLWEGADLSRSHELYENIIQEMEEVGAIEAI